MVVSAYLTEAPECHDAQNKSSRRSESLSLFLYQMGLPVSAPRRARPPLRRGNEWCKFSPRRLCTRPLCGKQRRPQVLMPPRWRFGWAPSYPIQSALSATNHDPSPFLLTSLRISEESPRTGAYSPPPPHHPPPGDTVAAVASFRLSSWFWSTSSLPAFSLSSRRCWYW